MLVAFAALLIHPQMAPRNSFSATNSAPAGQAAAAVIATETTPEFSLATPDTALPTDAAAQPVLDADMELPMAPLPAVALSSPGPAAFLKPIKPNTVTVGQLRAENRRNEMMWRGLAIGSSAAATFDAWSTRHAITTRGAQELNPLLRPFAGNASLYVAIQVAPALMDFAGRKMMYSRHSWVRRMWWAPQSASFVSSIICGSHNLTVH
jgi:hypothetical protein